MLELVLNLLLAAFVDEVSLISDDGERPARVDDPLDDSHTLPGRRRRTIDKDEGNLGLLDRGLSADGGVIVGACRLVHLVADTHGVDEPSRAAVELDEPVDGIACGAGGSVDDNVLAAGQRAQQGRLANIGATGEGDAMRTAGQQHRGNGWLGWWDLHDNTEEIISVTPIQGENGAGFAQAKTPQIGSASLL